MVKVGLKHYAISVEINFNIMDQNHKSYKDFDKWRNETISKIAEIQIDLSNGDNQNCK